jgi:tyrocidine synthetase-3
MELVNPAIQKQTVEYWMKKTSFAGEAPSLYWEDQAASPDVFTAILPTAVTDELHAMARNAVSEYTIYLSLYGFILYRYFGAPCLISSPDIKLFQPSLTDNLLFYAVDIREELSFKDLVHGFRQEIVQASDKRDFDIYTFLETASQKGIAGDRLRAFGFAHNQVNERTALPDQERLKLSVIVGQGQTRLEVRVNGLKDGAAIGGQFLDHYVQLLSRIGEIIHLPLSGIELGAKDEPRAAVEAEERTVVQLFAQQVVQRPQATAIVSRGSRLSYGSLDDDSNRLAAWLAEQQVGKGSTVGILVPRSEWILTGILGVLKTGAAFVPMDASWPAGRIEYMLADAGVSVLLTTTEFLPLVKSFTGKLFAFDIQLEMLPPAAAPAVDIDPEDTAYIMYTSGTTGRPKGVLVPHRGVANYAGWLHTEFGMGPADSSILVTSYAFDLGYTSIWGTLPWGGTLHIPGEDYGRMPEKLLAYLADEKISYVKFTPSLFKLLLSAAGSRLKERRLQLRLLFLGGEMIRPADLGTYVEVYPQAEFVNHYGPTESTVGCVFQRIPASKQRWFGQQPVIGSPIRGMRALILDEHGHARPDGLWGEIVVTGPGVAKGYLGQPEMTKEKFILRGSALYYRTGDYGRIIENGAIELKGRRDNQAKVRGYRVELEEIERNLGNYAGIREAAILLHRPEGAVTDSLLAFYTVQAGAPPIEEQQLHAWLATQLPDYMLPGGYFRIDQMPVNENGKINRRQLATLAESGEKRRNRRLAPANATESFLLETWERVLGKKGLSTDDAFFDIGGNSLLLIQVNLALSEVYPTLTITDLFTYTTIVGLAAFIDKAETTVAVNEAEWAVRLEEGVVDNTMPAGPTADPDEELQIRLEAGVLAGLKAVAIGNGVALTDILTGAWAYALTTCSAVTDVPLQVAGQNKLKRVVIPVTTAATKEALYRVAATQKGQEVELSDLVWASDRKAGADDVWPLLCLPGTDIRPQTAALFDVALSMGERGGGLSASLRFHPRLSAARMEELLQTFLDILEHAI